MKVFPLRLYMRSKLAILLWNSSGGYESCLGAGCFRMLFTRQKLDVRQTKKCYIYILMGISKMLIIVTLKQQFIFDTIIPELTRTLSLKISWKCTNRSHAKRRVNWLQAGLHSITCISTAPPSLALVSPQTSPLPLTPSLKACGINTDKLSIQFTVARKRMQTVIQSLTTSLSLPSSPICFSTIGHGHGYISVFSELYHTI